MLALSLQHLWQMEAGAMVAGCVSPVRAPEAVAGLADTRDMSFRHLFFSACLAGGNQRREDASQ